MSDPRDEWSADEPPRDFADRVMARIDAESRGEVESRGADAESRARTNEPARRARWIAGLAAGAALAASFALALTWHGARAPDHGDAIAADRTQLAMGARAVAVLERGSHVSWNGDDVEQTAGDVFYRVEPGGAFRVHTRAGDVQVLGTCFRVRVEGNAGNEGVVNGRDVKAGIVGAVVTAAAIVTVYEGKVVVSHAKDSVTLTAGESARTDGSGVHRGASADGAHATASDSDDPLVAANANLADAVREYKNRLETIESQKAVTERQLADAQKKLAVAENDGQTPPTKSEYDLSQDDLKELAKQGRVMARFPCGSSDATPPSPKTLEGLGLAPQDAQPIQQAYQESVTRVWGTIRPLCIQALLGDAKTADRLGPGTCQSLVGEIARKTENTEEETRLVAEIRAGMVPMPTDPKALGTYGSMLYTLSGETKTVEQELAKSIGPDDARRLIYSDESNMCSSSWGVGPRPTLPPTGTKLVTGTTGPSQ